MRRWHWFDAAWTALLLGLAGCGVCCDCPPALVPDKCFASTFEYEATPYPYELQGRANPACGDPQFERNEDMTQAAAPDFRECSGSRTAHLDGHEDVDVFRTGECKGSIVTNLPAPLVANANVTNADRNIRFCIFPLCMDGPTNLQACNGNADMRPDENGEDEVIVWDTRLDSGFIGCCRIGPGTLSASFLCPFRTREVDTYFWVDSGELPVEDACSAYTFTFDIDVD